MASIFTFSSLAFVPVCLCVSLCLSCVSEQAFVSQTGLKVEDWSSSRLSIKIIKAPLKFQSRCFKLNCVEFFHGLWDNPGGAVKKETLLALELSPDYRHEKYRCVRLSFSTRNLSGGTGGTEGEADAYHSEGGRGLSA